MGNLSCQKAGPAWKRDVGVLLRGSGWDSQESADQLGCLLDAAVANCVQTGLEEKLPRDAHPGCRFHSRSRRAMT